MTPSAELMTASADLMTPSPELMPLGLGAAYSAHREQPDRRIVNTQIGAS
jgi:hypothetical protein